MHEARPVGLDAIVTISLLLLAGSPVLGDQSNDLYAAFPHSLRECLESVPNVKLDGPRAHPRSITTHSLQTPIDDGCQCGLSARWCHDYLPSLYPGKTLGEMCEENFYTSPWLFQARKHNPFLIYRDQLQMLEENASERTKRLAWAAAYAYVHRDCEQWPADTFLATLSRTKHVRNEVLVDLIAPWLTSLVWQELTAPPDVPGQVPVDVRTESNVAYDSAASIERMLIQAAARKMKAIAITDPSSIRGFHKAQRIADRLKAEGRIPHDFVIIPGQIVYSLSGPILSLFTTRIIADGMTMTRTIRTVHADGGLAYMLHPGVPGGMARLANLDFDGYMIQPSIFEIFRTLSVINDPAYADMTVLIASNSEHSGTVGLAYSLVEAEEVSLQSLRQGFEQNRVYPVGELYLPAMVLAASPGVSDTLSFLNRYFEVHCLAEREGADLIGADTMSIRTSWDSEIRSMMGITGLPGGIADVVNGDSPLLSLPEVEWICAEYADFSIGYNAATDTALLEGVLTW